MKPIIEGPPERGEPPPPLGRRLIWFAVLWGASLLAVAAASYALRALIL